MRHHLLLSTATIAVAALAANSAHGASILGQSFNLDVSVDGSAVTSVSGTAGGGILTNFAEDQNFVTFGFDVKWVDEDSFDLTIYAPQNAADLTTATISLTGLAFKTPSLQTVDITKATFNPNENNYLGYFFSPENDTADRLWKKARATLGEHAPVVVIEIPFTSARLIAFHQDVFTFPDPAIEKLHSIFFSALRPFGKIMLVAIKMPVGSVNPKYADFFADFRQRLGQSPFTRFYRNHFFRIQFDQIFDKGSLERRLRVFV